MLPLSQIIQNHSVSHHWYADDIGLYVPLQSSNSSSLHYLLACLNDVKCWMLQNVLKCNEDKTKIIVTGPINSPSLVHSKFGSLTKNMKLTARNFGIIVDADLFLCSNKDFSCSVMLL